MSASKKCLFVQDCEFSYDYSSGTIRINVQDNPLGAILYCNHIWKDNLSAGGLFSLLKKIFVFVSVLFRFVFPVFAKFRGRYKKCPDNTRVNTPKMDRFFSIRY